MASREGPGKSGSGPRKTVDALLHTENRRKKLPIAGHRAGMEEEATPRTLKYPRNADLDPQLVWRGKDEQDWSDLVVQAPPLYIQEVVDPRALIDDLLRGSERPRADPEPGTAELFPDLSARAHRPERADFYQYDEDWSNRMILGDSLQAMASLAEREGLRGKVQCVYFDPPYGIKFNSNFQWSTTSREVKDGDASHITREPEQAKAFRDTWKDGIQSYLTYLRDRLTVARDLLSENGSIFVQIGDENVHRVRAVMDEVFGDENFVSLIAFTKGATGLGSSDRLPARLDYIVWYSRAPEQHKFHQLYAVRTGEIDPNFNWVQFPDGQYRRLTPQERSGEAPLPAGSRCFGDVSLTKPGPGSKFGIEFRGRKFDSGKRWWGMTRESLARALKTGRVDQFGNALRQLRFQDESSAVALGNLWEGFLGQSDPIYVVQTNVEIVKRCILMATDPGDLVLDPTCGSGTTATVAEQWGRRWITIDTSRVALALARARLMGARYPYYLLADSQEGQLKESEISRTPPSSLPPRKSIRQGFVYERVPHITLKSIAANTEIDVIWDKWQGIMEPVRAELNRALGTAWQEWEIPREAEAGWPAAASAAHARWWDARIARHKEMEASIAAKAEPQYLFDKPYEDKGCVRVAGPFTVESLSPHRMLVVEDDRDEFIDPLRKAGRFATGQLKPGFEQMIIENLKAAGIHQAHKEDKITFSSITPWAGTLVCADARYREGATEKRAAIFIGPEFGTVTRPDLAEAAREAGESKFDILIACAFNYDAHASGVDGIGRIPVLKSRMNADLHMASDLKATGKGNLFVVFGEPDIEVIDETDGEVRVRVRGVDVFDPASGSVRSDSTDGIACWFVDTDYNEETFFIRHAYFLGQDDPYEALRVTLRAQISATAWESLRSDTSRPFPRPSSGRIAVKVINQLGDEVMKVFRIDGHAHARHRK